MKAKHQSIWNLTSAWITKKWTQVFWANQKVNKAVVKTMKTFSGWYLTWNTRCTSNASPWSICIHSQLGIGIQKSGYLALMMLQPGQLPMKENHTMTMKVIQEIGLLTVTCTIVSHQLFALVGIGICKSSIHWIDQGMIKTKKNLMIQSKSILFNSTKRKRGISLMSVLREMLRHVVTGKHVALQQVINLLTIWYLIKLGGFAPRLNTVTKQ